MSRLDDRLTQEFERAARPAEPAGVFERVDRRRSRRHILRRVQVAALAVVVLAGTIGGFVFLSDAFRDGSTTIGGSVTPVPSPTITTTPGPIDIGLGFPVCDVRSMSADFDGNGTSDAASVATKMGDVGGCPAPGTSTEVLVVDLDGDGKADASGGPLACPIGCEPFAAPDVDADRLPEIAIVVDRADDGTSRIQLWDITTPPGGQLAVVPFVDQNSDPATFSWGTVVNWGGSGPERFGVSCTSRTSPPLVTEWQAIPTGADSWHISEHGYQVVGTELRSTFEDSYDVPGEETVFPDGGGGTMCGSPVYSGTRGQSIPDVGLDFRLCRANRLDNVDLLGDGTAGAAWTGVRVKPDGSCPSEFEGFNVVAVDHTGDGLADSWWGPMQYCIGCEPFDATDLNADGAEELVVLAQWGTVPQYLLFQLRTEAGQEPRVQPILVANPGHPQAGFRPGEPTALVAGGDEGFSGSIRCEGYPEAPVLVVTWSNYPVAGPGSETTEVHVTRLRLEEDGLMHVLSGSDSTQPTTDPTPGVSTGPACGVQFRPAF